MSATWDEVHSVARSLSNGRHAVRITNLAIAGQRRALLDGSSLLPGKRLRPWLSAHAMTPLPDSGVDRATWDRLADTAGRAAAEIGADLDGWVAAFQAQDPHRKSRGAYATPAALATELVRATLAPLANTRRDLRIVDPSAGAGSLLLAALRLRRQQLPERGWRATVLGMHGVELDPVARELCCLLLWLACDGAASLNEIGENIVVADSLTRDWWHSESPAYDVVLMNPPWESLRHRVSDSKEISSARSNVLERLQRQCPGAFGMPDLFSAQGRGDHNLFKMFAELAPHLAAEGGRLGLLVPGAFASDLGLCALRKLYLEHVSLDRWTCFENLDQLFPIDSRYKFGVLTGTRDPRGTGVLRVRAFAVTPEEIHAPHTALDRPTLAALGGPSTMFPEITSAKEVRVLKAARSAGTAFFSGQPFGAIRYRRELDLTLDRVSGAFDRTEDLRIQRVLDDGRSILVDGQERVPVVEGRMVGRYDFFEKSWEQGRGRTARWLPNDSARPLRQCKSQFLAAPCEPRPARIALCDVTSATNTRTVHATWVPPTWPCGNTAPVLEFKSLEMALAACAVLNSMTFDWLARRIVGGLHLNKFYLDAFVWPQLNGAESTELAGLGASLLAASSRLRAVAGGKAPRRLAADTDALSAHSRIESIVAQGFGLSRRLLETVFDESPDERRGFWRHFRSDLEASEVARRVLNGSSAEGATCRTGLPNSAARSESAQRMLQLSLPFTD